MSWASAHVAIEVPLGNTLPIPYLAVSLFYIPSHTEKGISVLFEANRALIIHTEDYLKVIGVLKDRSDHLYFIGFHEHNTDYEDDYCTDMYTSRAVAAFIRNSIGDDLEPWTSTDVSDTNWSSKYNKQM